MYGIIDEIGGNTMMLEKQLKGTRAKRPVIIFLHGFGKKRTGELEAFRKAFEHDYDICMPELFDPEDPKDSNGILWANSRAARRGKGTAQTASGHSGRLLDGRGDRQLDRFDAAGGKADFSRPGV